MKKIFRDSLLFCGILSELEPFAGNRKNSDAGRKLRGNLR